MTFQACSRCVMDNRDVPNIVFDSNGVCEYCLDYQSRERERKTEKTNLPWVYAQMRKAGEGKTYDVLLGLSGGVDSSTCLMRLIENGIRPLCFSVDNGWNSPKADENIMRLVEGLKVPFFRYVLDLEKFKELQAAFMRSGTANLEIPTDHVLMAASYEMAIKHGIKYIVGGGNYQTEAILPKSYGYDAKDLTFIKAVYWQAVGKKLTGLPTISLLQYLYNRFIRKIRVVNILDYYDYDREASIRELQSKFGWKTYGEKHCENTWTVWFQNFWLFVKHSLDKRKPHYSSLINSGQMTRAEALEKLAYAPEYPQLGIEQRALGYPKKDYKDYPNSEFWWKLLSRIYAFFKNR